MAALAFLIVGVVCSLISRVLLFKAALAISGRWAVGVLVPFGPMLFRMNYPEEVYQSRMFRLATLPCFFLYILLGPGPSYRHHLSKVTSISAQPAAYAIEKPAVLAKPSPARPGPKIELTPSLDDRRTVNTQEFEHLRAWAEALRLKKRDLLHSDTDGNLGYTAEFAQYNAALAKATAERGVIWPSAQ
jgi:hypothetical protein